MKYTNAWFLPVHFLRVAIRCLVSRHSFKVKTLGVNLEVGECRVHS